MKARPRLLDLFCGAGGASMGYWQAGFDVVGVDIAPQPNYPFEFHQSDALDYVAKHGGEFDIVHASPPCQFATGALNINSRASELRQKHINLIPDTRYALLRVHARYVIENVPNAEEFLFNPFLLCGTMFELPLVRHRLFESNIFINPPSHPFHKGVLKRGEAVGVYGHGGNIRDNGIARDDDRSTLAWRKGMAIPWMNRKELAQAIPPAYTKYIGGYIMAGLTKAILEREEELPEWVRSEYRARAPRGNVLTVN